MTIERIVKFSSIKSGGLTINIFLRSQLLRKIVLTSNQRSGKPRDIAIDKITQLWLFWQWG